jgi:hypothetical protein
MMIVTDGTRRDPRRVARAVRRAACAAAVLLASLLSTSAHAQPAPDRARVVAAIEAFRNVGKKMAESVGPLKGWAGFYSRGGRCWPDERSAQRPPGLWEKGQFALWSDEKYIYGMQLDASPAVFQYEYKFFRNVIGMDIYQLTRVDKLGAAAGADDAEWRLLAIGVPNPGDYGRLGIRIRPEFLARPDVNDLGLLSFCGDGNDGDAAMTNINFLERRLATLPK